jgi:hypothetical protein
MISEKAQSKGYLTITLLDENGQVKESLDINNLIVTSGKNLFAARLSGSGNSPSHIGVGTSAIAPTLSNTALGTQLARVSATPTLNSNTVQYIATFGPGVGTGTIAEAGLFNAASAGVMISRVAFTAFTKAAGDTLSITWNVSFI